MVLFEGSRRRGGGGVKGFAAQVVDDSREADQNPEEFHKRRGDVEGINQRIGHEKRADEVGDWKEQII